MKHLKAVIFDWAGTVVDHGSLAPMGAFVDAFGQFGVDVTIAEARGPMGMAKRPHIAALFALPRVVEAWTAKHGRKPSTLIPGVAQIVGQLRGLGLKIGSTTGYTRQIMAEILPHAAAQGFTPDNLVCTGDTAEGRPTPLMVYRTLLDLGVWPAWNTIKVDDTEVGIAEGLNAGAWSVGVAVSGNVFGLSREETEALSPEEFERRRADAVDKLTAAGAHYVIDSVADLISVIHAVEGHLARGERP
jgi:phosphonoacetaldehyde hydrolase